MGGEVSIGTQEVRSRWLWWPTRCSDGKVRWMEFVVEHRRAAWSARGVWRNGQGTDVPHIRYTTVSLLPPRRVA